jgi:hypothetical protein
MLKHFIDSFYFNLFHNFVIAQVYKQVYKL